MKYGRNIKHPFYKSVGGNLNRPSYQRVKKQALKNPHKKASLAKACIVKLHKKHKKIPGDAI